MTGISTIIPFVQGRFANDGADAHWSPFTNIFATQWEEVNLDRIAALGVDEVTPELLYERGVTRGIEFPVKVLGNGKLTTAVKVSAHAFSESAKGQIEAAGGSVETLERTDRWGPRGFVHQAGFGQRCPHQ